MGGLGIIMLFLALLFIGAGAMLALAACLVAGGILAVGVFSSSVVIGILKRSPTTAMKAFCLQLSAVAGGGCGLLGAMLALGFLDVNWTPLHAFLSGGLAGLTAGLLAGWLFNLAWVRIARGFLWLGRRLGERVRA